MHRKWNLVDFILVVMSFANYIMAGIQTGELSGVGVGRMLRLSRICSLMRLSRVMRQLPSLRIILMSILDSMVGCFWGVCSGYPL